jgi:hypothetical protein
MVSNLFGDAYAICRVSLRTLASSEATPHAVGDGTEEQQDDGGDRKGSVELRLEACREGHKYYQQQGERREHVRQFAATWPAVQSRSSAPPLIAKN